METLLVEVVDHLPPYPSPEETTERFDLFLQPKGFRFPTPNKDQVVPENFYNDLRYAISNRDVAGVLAICQHWAGSTALSFDEFDFGYDDRIGMHEDEATIVRALVYAGANIHNVDYKGYQIMVKAARSQRPSIVRFLLDEGGRVDELSSRESTGALYEAVASFPFDSSNKITTVQMLLDAGVPNTINAPSVFGYSPLSVAKRRGDRHMIDLLRHHGAEDTKGCFWIDYTSKACCTYPESFVFPCCIVKLPCCCCCCFFKYTCY